MVTLVAACLDRRVDGRCRGKEAGPGVKVRGEALGARVVGVGQQVKGPCQRSVTDWSLTIGRCGGGSRGYALPCVSGLWELEVDGSTINWERK